MTSFDYRLNPIYAIKECSSCRSLYTSNCGCSKGSLEDKILVPIIPSNLVQGVQSGIYPPLDKNSHYITPRWMVSFGHGFGARKDLGARGGYLPPAVSTLGWGLMRSPIGDFGRILWPSTNGTHCHVPCVRVKAFCGNDVVVSFPLLRGVVDLEGEGEVLLWDFQLRLSVRIDELRHWNIFGERV
ncbi:hypothetical protein Tco_1337110 [Tanacetum coccineum]